MTAFEYGICFIAGVVFITLGILHIRKITSFKTEVRAEYVKNTPFPYYRGNTRYSPVFKYKFESAEIIKESFQRFEKKALPLFEKGKTYTIFVNEKNPEQFVIERKTPFWDVLLAVVMFLIGFSAFIALFISFI